MSKSTMRLSMLRSTRTLIVLALVIIFAAATTYSLMSDTSVHGLATKITYANRYCNSLPTSSAKNVTFYVLASLWSASSLHTSISHVTVSLSVDGVSLGTASVPDSSWDPGKYATFTATFLDSGASPASLPAVSSLVLAVTGTATAGLASASVTASDSAVESLGNTSC